jgi:hypothetical protein
VHRSTKRPLMSEWGLGCVKTKSDLVVMPSGRQIFPFFALRITTEPKIPGAVIPRRVFTQPGSFTTDAVEATRACLSAVARKRTSSRPSRYVRFVHPDCSSQGDAITHQPQAAILIFATMGIINPIAVAHIEAAQTTVLPDGVLHKPREGLWKS